MNCVLFHLALINCFLLTVYSSFLLSYLVFTPLDFVPFFVVGLDSTFEYYVIVCFNEFRIRIRWRRRWCNFTIISFDICALWILNIIYQRTLNHKEIDKNNSILWKKMLSQRISTIIITSLINLNCNHIWIINNNLRFKKK